MEEKTDYISKGQNKGGRPPLAPDDQRTVRIALYVTSSEAATIDERRKQHGLTKAAYIRKMALGELPSKIDGDALELIRRASVNMNQIARWANTIETKNEETAAEMQRKIVSINNALHAISMHISSKT